MRKHRRSSAIAFMFVFGSLAAAVFAIRGIEAVDDLLAGIERLSQRNFT